MSKSSNRKLKCFLFRKEMWMDCEGAKNILKIEISTSIHELFLLEIARIVFFFFEKELRLKSLLREEKSYYFNVRQVGFLFVFKNLNLHLFIFTSI